MDIKCNISLGELVDKISILKIKLEMIKDEAKLNHVRNEEKVLMTELDSLKLNGIESHLEKMVEVNLKLWNIEDEIRECERNKSFDENFIKLARLVYITNDERFRRKQDINNQYNSNLHEVKSYKQY